MPRRTDQRMKLEAVDQALRDMFRSISRQPLPDRLRSIVDQLDDGEDSSPAARVRSR